VFSERASSISPSLTLAISAKAKAMKKQGLDVVGFGAGEPDFDTPAHIKEKAKQAVDSGYTKYTPASGMPELKETIIKKFERDNDLSYEKDEIIVGCGAKHVIFEIIFSLIEKGDEVIIPSPYWLSYPEMVKLAGGKPVFADTSGDSFKITPDTLAGFITDRTKLLILNSPSNPTGVVYTKEELEGLSKIIETGNLYCISDEIYEKLIYDGIKHISIASLSAKMRKKTIVINGVSKAYSMTGWRIGYGAGPEQIIKIASSIQSHTTSNPASISQMASIEALEGSQDEVYKMGGEFRRRRDYLIERIAKIKSLSLIQGAFYCFVNISTVFGKKFDDKEIDSSITFSEVLLDKEMVAVVPGIAFGNDNFIRLSYATSMQNLKKGLDRIERFVDSLR